MFLPGEKISFDVMVNTGAGSDGMGGKKPKWDVLIAVTDGRVATAKLGNYEAGKEGKISTFSSLTFYMYYDSRVNVKHRIRYNNKDYTIIKVDDPAGQHNHLQIKVDIIENT